MITLKKTTIDLIFATLAWITSITTTAQAAWEWANVIPTFAVIAIAVGFTICSIGAICAFVMTIVQYVQDDEEEKAERATV